MNLPILLPISPISDNEPPQNPVAGISALETAVLESPTAAVKDVQDTITELPSRGSGLFGWMKEAMPGKSILAKVAEKARSSVDTMITTLDPQMKEFICMFCMMAKHLKTVMRTNFRFIDSGGDIDIAVASSKELKVSAVREAFQTVYGKATVK